MWNDVNKEEIEKIYKNYFDLIDSFFGSIKHYLWDEKDSHLHFGMNIASYPLISDLIIDSIWDLDKEIKYFWKQNANKLFKYIKWQNTLKCLYSWDITPVILEDFITKSCLYVDTVIIPDPIYNLSVFQEQIIIDKKYYLNKLLRHIFNIWKLKDLILSSSKVDILLIVPINLSFIQKDERENLINIACDKFTNYVNLFTNESTSNYQEALELLNKNKSIEDILQLIKPSKIIPYNLKNEWFLEDFLATWKYTSNFNSWSWWGLWIYLQSQFLRVQEHKYFCEKLLAEPIYDYELPWFFFNYDCWVTGIDNWIINSLQKEKLDWIKEVPISVIKKFREEDKLEYMRSLLRRWITDLKVKNDDKLIKTSEQIEANFKEAFKQQQSEIKLLEKEASNILKKEIPIVTWGAILWAIPGIWIAVSIASAWRDIKNHLENYSKDKKILKNKESDIINILMKSYDKK